MKSTVSSGGTKAASQRASRGTDGVIKDDATPGDAASNAITIDFEDWYQGLTSTSQRPQDWPAFERRIQNAGTWLLKKLAQHGVRATFFIVGEVAREHPDLVRAIAAQGHAIGMHGDMHRRVDSMSRAEFAADIRANIAAIQKASGVVPRSFRAPCFSISKDTPWVWEELAAAGVRVDSSVFPVRSLLYGMPEAPRQPYVVETRYGPVTEVPVTTVPMMGSNLPFSGGFYFRALPYRAVALATRRLNARGQGVVFYFHPWEFDPDHPRPESVTRREALSHYGFLAPAAEKFSQLLNQFRFETVFSDSPRADMKSGSVPSSGP